MKRRGGVMSCRETVGERIVVNAISTGFGIVIGAVLIWILLGSQEIKLAEGSTVAVTVPELLPSQNDRIDQLESEIQSLKANGPSGAVISPVPVPPTRRGAESDFEPLPKDNPNRRFEAPKGETPQSQAAKNRKHRFRVSDAQRSALENWF
jgi:hypothetical protein